MAFGPRYRTLRDYLAVIRARRMVVVLCTVLFGGAALALTLSQTPEYKAEAALDFRAIERELDLLGTPVTPSGTPQANSTVNAEFTESDAVARAARRKLRAPEGTQPLLASVDAQPEAATGFVIIEARSTNAVRAAATANATAQAAVEIRTRREKTRLKRAADALRRETERQTKGADQFSAALFGERVARIEALADFARPVEIVRTADVPGSPASPKVARTTLLGLLVGLVVGLMLAFIRDALDTRVRVSADVRREVDLPLLGAIRGGALGRTLPDPDGGDPRDIDAFRVVRTNLDFLSPERAVRTVAVTSAAEGEGKTTVAAGLARAAAASGRSALLIECDLRRPQLAARLDTAPSPGLADLLAGTANPREAIRRLASSPNGSDPARGLDFIPAGEASGASFESLGSPAFRDLLAVLSRSYDQLILDTTPILAVADTLHVVPLVDAIVLCARSSRTTRDQLRAAKDALDRFPARPCGVVLTGIEASEVGHYGESYAGHVPAASAG